MVSLLAFLDAAGGTVTRLALGLFLVINGVFAAMVILRQDRGLVNRWTKRLVVADTALLLAAGGAPVATWAARTTIKAVAAVLPSSESWVAPANTSSAPTPQQ